MDEAIAYLRAHVPAGMKLDGTGTGSRYGVITSESISYAIWTIGDLRDVSLNIFVAPYRGGVGVGMYATTDWVPSRPPRLSDRQPDIGYRDRPTRRGPRRSQYAHAPTVRRVLHGAVVGKLASAVNRLQPPIQTGGSCTYTYAEFDDTLVFATPTGSVHVFATTTGCTKLTLDFNDGRHLDLAPGGLDAAVLHALGLPRNYGFR